MLMHYKFARKNGFKSLFSPILLSERNLVIDYVDKIHYNRFFFSLF